MAHALGFDTETLHEAIRISVPEKFIDLNLKLSNSAQNTPTQTA